MHDFLFNKGYEILCKLIGIEIKKLESEVPLPLGTSRVLGSKGRIDLMATDRKDRIHIFEIKYIKDGKNKNHQPDLLENAQGIAQLLVYDAILANVNRIEVASMNLITNYFDPIYKTIVPRNNLKRMRVARLTKEALEIVTGYTHVSAKRK